MNKIKVVAAVIVKNNQLLIAKRPDGKHKAGYWEFPGGKMEQDELPLQALAREIKEELDIVIDGGEFFEWVNFSYPEKEVSISFYLVKSFKGRPSGLEGQIIKWVALEDLAHYQFPEANLAVLNKLLTRMR